MKKCRVCRLDKETIHFYKNSRYKDCKDTICKLCAKNLASRVRAKNELYYKRYYKTRSTSNIHYIFIRRYSSMRLRASSSYMGDRDKSVPSREEFIRWCYSSDIHEQFKKVYKVYKDSGFLRKYVPTIDRVNTKEGYKLDNMQWLTFSDNVKKMYDDYNKRSKK